MGIDEKLAKAAAEEAGDNFANISDETANEKYERDQVDQGLAESIQSDEGMLTDSGQKDKVEEGKVNAIMAEKKAITGEVYGVRNESTLDKVENVMVDTKIKNFLSDKYDKSSGDLKDLEANIQTFSKEVQHYEEETSGVTKSSTERSSQKTEAKNPTDERRHHTEMTKESASVIHAAKKS